MGKGYKRKTRWRTLNIAAPPGEEGEDDEVQKSRDNGARNGTPNHKQYLQRSEAKAENGITTNDSAGASLPRSQPKIIFNESEYTRITTPRQDMLFKKGYLAKKLVWSSNNASTSATPSTTESQSASHSTADGSEITEDQQLFDCRDSGVEEYPPMTDPTAHMSYGTFYDHVSGYYYEYPVMMVGPPIPGPPMHNVLATMPCEAVPLRPIEWVNPAFMPKLEQPYCLMDYQNQQITEHFPPDENGIHLPFNNTNGTEEIVENGTGNGCESWTGDSVIGEEQIEEEQQENVDEKMTGENGDGVVADTSFPIEPCLETVLNQQLHVSHHVAPPQPYMYPGHYMFGPALINVNGMTIQNGPMVRNSGVIAGAPMYTKRRNRKKMSRRKSRRPFIHDNNENCGQDEEDYSSEAENTRLTPNSFAPTSHPLNPDCKEFQLRPTVSHILSTEPVPENPDDETNGNDSSGESSISPPSEPIITSVEYATEAMINEQATEVLQETEIGIDATCAEFSEIEEISKASEETNGLSEKYEETNALNVKHEETNAPNGKHEETNVLNGKHEEINCLNGKHEETNGLNEKHEETNGKVVSNGSENHSKKLTNGDSIETELKSSIEVNQIPEITSPNSRIVSPKPNMILRKKYKANKFVREATPGPEVNTPTIPEARTKPINMEVALGVEAIEIHEPGSSVSTIGSYTDKKNNDMSEDSGFESQTRFPEHPITDAVTQWLKRAKSPDLFLGLKMDGSDDEDDEPDDIEPSKNLRGNPMPALSPNSVAGDVKSSGFATRRRKRANNKGKKTRLSSKNRDHREKKEQSNESDVINCEFTVKDSVAGMRVAKSTRNQINEELKVNVQTTWIESSRNDELAINSDVNVDVNNINLRTFERGEIIVAMDGKLVPTTMNCVELCDDNDNDDRQAFSEEDFKTNSIGSIEEADVLECWETETIEPLHAKKFISRCKREQTNEELDPAGLELVRKYYRLARDSIQSGSSIDDNDAKSVTIDLGSRLASPEPVKVIKFQREDSLAIEEAIEIYQSCYSGKPRLSFDPHLHKSYLLYGYEDRPMPCQAACCNVQ